MNKQELFINERNRKLSEKEVIRRLKDIFGDDIAPEADCSDLFPKESLDLSGKFSKRFF